MKRAILEARAETRVAMAEAAETKTARASVAAAEAAAHAVVASETDAASPPSANATPRGKKGSERQEKRRRDSRGGGTVTGTR